MGSIIKTSQLYTSDPVMKIAQLFFLGVLAVMCSSAQSQSQEATLARPPPPSGSSGASQFLLQQSGDVRRFPGGRNFVYDSKCRVYRRVGSKQDCPMAFNFRTYQPLCNDFDLADDSADVVYQAYIYNTASQRYTFCRYTHACVACPIVNEECPRPFFRGSRSGSEFGAYSDDEIIELEDVDYVAGDD